MVISHLYLSMNLLTFFLPESRCRWKSEEVIHLAESCWEAMSQALCYALGIQRWGKTHVLHLWRILQPSILRVGRKPLKGKNMCRRKVGLSINKYFFLFSSVSKYNLFLHGNPTNDPCHFPTALSPSLILQIASGLLGPCLTVRNRAAGKTILFHILGFIYKENPVQRDKATRRNHEGSSWQKFMISQTLSSEPSQLHHSISQQ